MSPNLSHWQIIARLSQPVPLSEAFLGKLVKASSLINDDTRARDMGL
jgi:hypothetical protein